MFDGFGLVVTQIAVVAAAAGLFGVVLGWLLGGARERRRAERATSLQTTAAAVAPETTRAPAPPAPSPAAVEARPPETAAVIPFGGRRYAD